MIVVDTSALVALLRGDEVPAAAILARLESDGTPFLIPAICAQEVLQGARDESEWSQLDDLLGTQRQLASDDPIRAHREAARIYFDCRRAGVTVRSAIDCVVAQQVLDIDGMLLHADRDYERIATIRPLRTLTT